MKLFIRVFGLLMLSSIGMANFASTVYAANGPATQIGLGHDLSSSFVFDVDPHEYQAHVLETQLDETFITAAKKHFEIAKTGDTLTHIYTSKIQRAWQQENFKTLEDTLYQFREKMGPTLPNGNATQPLFYGLIAEVGAAYEQGEQKIAFRQRIANWQKQYPTSSAPNIALAKYLLNKATEARGWEYANNTPMENLNKFHSMALSAYEALDSARTQHKKLDPEFYATEISVLMCASAPNVMINDSFHAGLAVDPDYLPLYDSMSFVVMPRWKGDSDDLVSLAYFAAAKHPRYHNTDGLYVRVVQDVLWGTARTPEEFLSYGFSWPIIKSGYIHDAKFSGLSTARLDMFCWLAVLYNDKPTAKILFDILQDTRYRAIWGEDDVLYRKAQNWAHENISNNPLRPDLEQQPNLSDD